MNRKNLGLILLFVAMLLSSCWQDDKVLSTPEFEKALGDLAVTRSERIISSLRRSLDSAFAQVQHKKPLDYYNYYEYYSWYYLYTGEYDISLKYTDSMLSVITPLPGVALQYVNTLTRKGIIYQKLNLYPAALNEFYSAGSFAERFLDACGSAKVYDNLGVLLFEQRSYQDAIYYFEKAIEGSMTCDTLDYHNFFLQLQSVYNSIGLCHEREGQLDSARVNYEKGLQVIERYQHNHENDKDFIEAVKAILYGNLGYTELLSKNYSKADRLLTQSINLSLEKKYFIHDAIYTRIKQGQLALETRQLNRLPSIMDSVQNELAAYPDLEASRRLHVLEMNYFIALGDSARAFLARENQTRVETQIADLKKELPSLNIPKLLSYFKQKEELKRLQVTNKRNVSILVLSILLLLFSGVIVLLYRKNLKIAKANAFSLASINEELKTKNIQLLKTMEDLEISQRENTRMLEIIAHDLRSPIGGIQGRIASIMDSELLGSEFKKELKSIHIISTESLQFMDNLLNRQSGLRVEDKKETDMLELIDYCISFLQVRAEEKKQHITLSGPHVFVPIYRERIWRVFSNLLSNAIKFSPVGGKIKIEIEESETTVQVMVQDSGIGIPASMDKKIFDVVADARRQGTAGERSFGLGLAISLQIMQAHNGRIWFESVENKGSKFFLEFPKR